MSSYASDVLIILGLDPGINLGFDFGFGVGIISIVGFGALFELYSSRFLMTHFWAVIIVLFALAFTLSELLGLLARKVDYYASKRSQ